MSSRWSRWSPFAAVIAACQPPVDESPAEPASSSETSATLAEPVDPPPTTTDPTTGEPLNTTTSGEPATTDTTAAETTGTTETTETTDESSSSSAADLPECGDGIIDPGETCDDGYAANSNSAACTLDCQTAVCGDGLVWEGEELCDHGPNNNDMKYAGCTTQCAPGPHCGDGVLQVEEECDLADLNGTGEFLPNGVPCESGCKYRARLVFLSSAAYRGGDLGGIAQADDKCQDLALAAGFDNHLAFMAWLSDGQTSPAERFTKYPDMPEDTPYVLPSGVRLADGWDDLLLDGPGDGIVETEKGEISLYTEVWTNTDKNGETLSPDNHCEGWTSSSLPLKSRRGLSGVEKTEPASEEWKMWKDNDQWTNFVSGYCGNPFSLYCFEQ